MLDSIMILVAIVSTLDTAPCNLSSIVYVHIKDKFDNTWKVFMCISLVPRRGGGGERAPGTHCLRMRVIIAKATWQN